jgi:dienelactone hydrolase
MKHPFKAVACATLLLVACPSHAQTPSVTERLVGATRAAPDLNWPSQPRTPGPSGSPVEMALYKPAGDGPFPALVLAHQCGGLNAGRWSNQSMLDWARRAVGQGYVVLQVDSLGPRGVDSVCMSPKGGVNFMRGARDLFQAGHHLASLPYVDKARIGAVGFSWGAMNAVLAAGQTWRSALGAGTPIKALAAVYPGCFTLKPPTGSPYEIVNPDIDTPLLVLMGEDDNETPATECVQKLEPLKARGAPVQWHVYPKTTHCWDCQNLDGFRKVDARGNQVLYRYDASVTQDSASRIFDFLASALGPAR